ncbi:chemotaxis protein CheB [Nodularia spumigena]|uniref:protein-glutamate methylesterase n=1 Tax=Nodularia spumigena CENA596 TaxID=1819295 RepID=A0A166IGR8_NODSP|nr:chemotaxis protein CheB [Nodularia spumigena]KZL48380.1 chemotaxis protein [Nodularia spumigena CENA596]MDB9317113.1 chemotaxis protein CheB [Nodularia spumigena CS-590/01A]MDB9327234.1 chemotaxis protein CheB [Nodularia spumigena CS-590/02]MDB9337252.1 chemotaxis protein CheB [Nodularia spumigena CS-590/01]MDB9349977.1 chemotaxis protein CheB [Nodularia spumigena CS-588/01]
MIQRLEDAQNYPPRFANASFDIVAIASSAGGLTALTKLLSTLPKDFSAAIAIVQHLAPQYPSVMPEILARHTALEVKHAEEGDCLTPGTVYIAPPDYHLLVNSDGTVSLSQSKQIHFVRPSADVLFASVAACYKHRAIAIVLTGMGRDGATGVEAIHKMGGTVISQDTNSSEFSGMPNATINTGDVDFILPLDEISRTLVTLVMN